MPAVHVAQKDDFEKIARKVLEMLQTERDILFLKFLSEYILIVNLTIMFE